MMQHSEKTVPYRLSQAELENLRLLRKRMNPSSSIPEGEEDKTSEEIDVWNSNRSQLDNTTEKKDR
jgi:hypothetical protein